MNILKPQKILMKNLISIDNLLDEIKKDDKIDMAAGIVLNRKKGDELKKGDILAYIHTNRKDKIISK